MYRFDHRNADEVARQGDIVSFYHVSIPLPRLPSYVVPEARFIRDDGKEVLVPDGSLVQLRFQGRLEVPDGIARVRLLPPSSVRPDVDEILFREYPLCLDFEFPAESKITPAHIETRDHRLVVAATQQRLLP